MTIKVPVVEDNPELREGLTRLIQGTSYATCAGAYGSCEDLLAAVAKAVPDVVLMDIGLPGMSGVEGVTQVRALCPSADILMLTVHEDEDSIFEAIRAGASGYLLKKTPPAKILEAIREIHEGGAPMTASVARKVLALLKKEEGREHPEVRLSRREVEVLTALVRGDSYKMIADALFISIDTVRSHIKTIYEKLHVHSKSEAVAAALKNRLV